MKNFITINQSGDVLTTITSNDPNLMVTQDLNLVEVSSADMFDKIKENPRNFAHRNNCLVEKSEIEKQAIRTLHARNKPVNIYQVIKDLEARVEKLEHEKT